MAGPLQSSRSRLTGDPLGARGRLLAALTLSLIVLLALPARYAVVRLLAAWDAGALAMIVTAWAIIASATPERTRARAGSEDPGRSGVFVIALVSSLASLVASLVVLRVPDGFAPGERGLVEALAVLAILEAWVLTHTMYTLRYARLYYKADPDGEGGLEFPGMKVPDSPDDLDFAYLAFTVGMTFQVSDTLVTSREMRRAVLWHSLQSFVFNSAILALALNLFFNILGKG